MDVSDFEFFKIILDVSFDRLKLHEKFAELLKGREPREMKLREADAGSDSLFVAEVLVNGVSEFFLGNGWKQFARSYNLDVGHVLFLTYDGVNTLTVKVFEPTACRRFYHDDNTADPDTVLAKFCVFPKGVSLDDRQKIFVKDFCVIKRPKIPFYICRIVQSHIDKAKGKMYFNQEYTRTHLSNFLSTAGAIDVKIHDISNEKIGDFCMEIGANKEATITHKWLSVTTGQKWDAGDIVMFWFRHHGVNSLRLDVQKI